MVTNLPCNLNNFQSVLPITLVHQSGAARYKVRRRRPKHNLESNSAKIETTLGNVQPFSIDVKGGGKERRKKALLKSKHRKKDASQNERGRKS